jgi:hypothetical protein
VAQFRIGAVARLDSARRERGGQRVVLDAVAAQRERGLAAAGRGGDRAARRPLAAHGLAHARGDLLAERLQRRGVVARQDEGRHAVLERERRELLDPLCHRPLEASLGAGEDRAAHVEQSPNLGRASPRALGGLVDRRIAALQVAGLQVRERGEPAVRRGAGQAQHARLVGAEPDRDGVSRSRAALGAVHAVESPLDPERPPLARVPHAADDLDRLAQRRDPLAGRELRAAHALDRVPEAAGPQAQREAAARQQVQRGGGARQDGGLSQWQVQDVARDRDAGCGRRDPAEQRPRVVESRLVGVVLERDEVEPRLLGQLGEPHGLLGVAVGRSDERAEAQLLAVVGHPRFS